MDELKLFARAIFSHWLTLMSGGVIIVAVGIFERVTSRNVSWSIYVTLICVLIVVSSFLAWRDKHNELLDKSLEANSLKQELANEREPIRREFDAIRLRLLTSTLVPEITQELGNLKALILSRRELLARKDVGDFFDKWIKPFEIHLHFGAQLDLRQAQYEELKQDLASIGHAPAQET
jgi:hypothetical protein